MKESWNTLLTTEFALDAFAQDCSGATEHDAHGDNSHPKPRGDQIWFQRFLVTHSEQLTGAALDRLQTFSQSPRMIIQLWPQFFVGLADLFHYISLEAEKVTGITPPGHKHLPFGDTDGPTNEGPLSVIFREFAKEDDRDFLQQGFSLVEIRHQGTDIT